MELRELIAEKLLEIKAVFLSPNKHFIWASGIKSPIYCDNRLILTAPEVRTLVEDSLKKEIEINFPDVEALFGTATAGIPHSAIVADKMNLPMGYVRSNSKGHGRQNKIEGKLEKGTKVVVVEDLISTAGSVLDSVEALREAGAEVIGVVSIFTYNMKEAKKKMEENGVKSISLTNFDTVIDVARKKSYIQENDVNKLLSFRENPKDEKWLNA